MRIARATDGLLAVQEGPFWVAETAPDGSLVALGCENGSVRLWDIRWRRFVGSTAACARAAGIATRIERLGFSRDGRTLAAATRAGRLSVWNISTPGSPRLIRTAPFAAAAIAVSPDGQTIAAHKSGRVLSFERRPLVLSDVRTGSERTVGAGLRVEAFAFAPDGRVFVAVVDGVLYEVALAPTGRPSPPLSLGDDCCDRVALDSDARLLALERSSGQLELWDARGRSRVRRWSRPADAGGLGIDVARRARQVALGNFDGTIELYDGTAAGSSPERLRGHRGSVPWVSFGPRGILASLNNRGTVVVRGDAGALTRRLPPERFRELNAESRRIDELLKRLRTRPAHRRLAAEQLALSADGSLFALVTYHDPPRVEIWDARRLVRFRTIPFSEDFGLAGAVFGPSSGILAVFGFRVELRHPRTGARLGELTTGDELVSDLAFSADGRLLVVADSAGDLRFWDLPTRKQTSAAIAAHADSSTLAISPDGTTLASGGRDAVVKLSDLESGRPLADPLTAGLAVEELAFESRSGSLVALESRSGATSRRSCSGERPCGTRARPPPACAPPASASSTRANGSGSCRTSRAARSAARDLVSRSAPGVNSQAGVVRSLVERSERQGIHWVSDSSPPEATMDESAPDSPRPRAFVVMPFGTKDVPSSPDAPEGTRRVDFDRLYRLLIGPALGGAGLEPFRADQEVGAGDIRTDMFFELVTGDVVVADISILNANVFYELGVRHGVAERGVFMIHAGWTRRPFDVAPDRTFHYEGTLFEPQASDDETFDERLRAEVRRLGNAFRNALAVDRQTVGSPVYAALPGMRPPDWSVVDNARAKYFHGALDEWRKRVRIARRNGFPGDILTLARDAPSRIHRNKLLLEAARGLSDLERFDIARGVLDELLESDGGNVDAQCRLGLVLGRLGRAAEAEELIGDVLRAHAGHPEAEGVLGRINKDAWRSSWRGIEDLEERRSVARSTAARARLAIRSYRRSHTEFRDSYYTGVNVVGLARLLADLDPVAVGDDSGVSVDDLAVVVRVAARDALDRARNAGAEGEVVWPAATLGELALVEGETARAVGHYEEAVAAPGVTLFQLESMLSQLGLYEELGFRAEGVAAVRAALEPARDRVVPPVRSFAKVVVGSGHMIDTPDRAEPRFPPSAEEAVKRKIREQLDAWAVGPGDLAICGGARGADILFGEACIERGAHLRLFLPVSESEFRRRSVRLQGDGGRWEDRFESLLTVAETAEQEERLGEPPPGKEPFGRNNLWMLDTARVEAQRGRFSVILVWDGKPTGEGPGGTSDFARRAERVNARVRTINPLEV